MEGVKSNRTNKDVKIEYTIKEKYKNIKHQQIYFKIDEIRDTTNDRQGNVIVLYLNPVTLEIYARDKKEFLEKFERVR